MEYIKLSWEVVYYAQICAGCLMVIAACQIAEFVQTMRIKAVELRTAKQNEQNTLTQAELLRLTLEEKKSRPL